MMIQVVYISRGGNTEQLTEAIAEGAGVKAVATEQFDASRISDILFIGASIYTGSIDGKLSSFLVGLHPAQVKRVVMFGTSAGNKTALSEIKALLEPTGIAVADEEFHCRGSFLFANRGQPNAEDFRAAGTFAKKLCGGRV